MPGAGACNIALVLHGCVILIVSQVAGYALLFAINARRDESAKVALWRMSHSACSAGAVFLIALAPVVSHLDLSPSLAAFLVEALVVSTYGLCLGTVVAGASGHRGTRLRLPWPNLVACLLYLVGVLGSTVSAIVLVYGAARAYLSP
jgi:hypothetical protein